MADFERLGICPELIRAIQEEGWLLPTPVQDETIPLFLGGGDVCVAAETGSGKTGAFVLPCLQLVHETLREKATCLTNLREQDSDGCYFDINDKCAVVALDAKRTVASSEVNRWAGVRCTGSILKGRGMFEVTIEGDGLVRVGWAAPYSVLELGKDSRSFGFGGTGKKSVDGVFTEYGTPFGKGNVIGCYIDRNERTIEFSKDGTCFGVAFNIPASLDSIPLKPAVCGKCFKVKLTSAPPFQYPLPGYPAIPHEHTPSTSCSLKKKSPLCLIVEPTRDLARQTYDVLTRYQTYFHRPQLRSVLLVGGSNYGNKRPFARLEKEGADIVVGTLFKIADAVHHFVIELSRLHYLILDEADELIAQDTRGDLQTFKSCSHTYRVQTLLFSATLDNPDFLSAVDDLTVNASWVNLKGKSGIPDTVHFVYYKVDPHQDSIPCSKAFRYPNVLPPTDGVHLVHHADFRASEAEQLSYRVKLLKPQIAIAIADTLGMSSCFIFCRTNLDCDNFESYLVQLNGGQRFRGSGSLETCKGLPYNCVVLAGMRSEEERQRSLNHFTNGDVRFLVCTDVAARGIDISGLPFVIMMSLPDDPSVFFHRVGRVGRQDKMGLAVSLVSSVQEKVWYHNCSDRGRNCSNRELHERNGCCVWYDEPSYLKKVEAKIGATIPEMHPRTFSVEGILEVNDPNVLSAVESEQEEWLRHEKTSTGSIGNALSNSNHLSSTPSTIESLPAVQVTIYGKPKVSDYEKRLAVQAEEIAPNLSVMEKLEVEVQRSYIHLLYHKQ